MAEVLVSPGIQITETDKSFVPARPLVAGAAIIGPTPKGAVNAPTVVTSYGDYQQRFGTTFMMNRYDPDWRQKVSEAQATAKAEVISNVKEIYTEQGGVYTPVDKNANGLYEIVEGTTYYEKSGEAYVEISAADIQALNNATKEAIKTAEKNAAERAIEGAKLQQKKQEYLTSIAAKSYFEQGGESLLVIRVADNDFSSGKAAVPTVGDSSSAAFVLRTISQGENQNNWSGDYQDRTETTASITNVIREDGSLVSGSKDNIRWEVANVDPATGTFSIYVRRGDDTDSDKMILEAFSGLSLDPDSENYIARRIGDQHQALVSESVGDNEEVYYVSVLGNYPNISKYIYVESVNDIYGYLLPNGYTPREGAAEQLPKSVEGGFSEATGKLFSSEEDEASALFFEDIKDNNSDAKIQGIDPERYEPLISCLENMDEYQINIISVPGLTVANNEAQCSMINSLAQKRGDLIAVVDLVGFESKITDVCTKAEKINSSYSATYWPWLQMYSSTGRLEWVPASVIIPGVYTYTDHVAAPWFAPAGMTRGSVQGVVQPERKLLKQHRDELYKKNINPIAILPGSGITIYGQKTLQKKATALDRVNVRRLLIELKNTVKNMASGLLFEINDAQLRSTFKANLDSYLESVVKRRGLYSYKTIVEELNTPDVIDRNEFRCQIYIQPTKVIEFIYIDFTITNTGVEFNN